MTTRRRPYDQGTRQRVLRMHWAWSNPPLTRLLVLCCCCQCHFPCHRKQTLDTTFNPGSGYGVERDFIVTGRDYIGNRSAGGGSEVKEKVILKNCFVFSFFFFVSRNVCWSDECVRTFSMPWIISVWNWYDTCGKWSEMSQITCYSGCLYSVWNSSLTEKRWRTILSCLYYVHALSISLIPTLH